MNSLKRKFWLWWFTKCPVGYSFMGHENGKLFWFYPFGINFRYRKGQYISIHLSGKLTQRALDWLAGFPILAEWAQNANQ